MFAVMFSRSIGSLAMSVAGRGERALVSSHIPRHLGGRGSITVKLTYVQIADICLEQKVRAGQHPMAGAKKSA